MSQSIYNILAWDSSTTYSQWDIVSRNGLFWYSIQNSNTNQTPAVGSSYWDGNATFLGATRPRFFFTPSYNPNFGIQPNVDVVQFGDGYQQRVAKNINSILLGADLVFEKRAIAEATAILHFLNQRQGKEAFIFTPPQPFDQAKLFRSPQWSMTQPFYNNYSIRAAFEEVVN